MYMYECMYTGIHDVCMNICMYVRTYVCMYVYIDTHTCVDARKNNGENIFNNCLILLLYSSSAYICVM